MLLLALGSLVSTVVGLLFVRPVPPASAVGGPTTAAVDREEGEERTAEEVSAEAEAALSEAGDDVPAARDSAPRQDERTPLLRSTSSKSVQERNISGWALFHELDFYLIFLFNGLCAGVGLCCKCLSFSLLPLHNAAKT